VTQPEPAAGGHERLVRLRASLAARGFNLLLPLSEAAFDGACAPVAPELRLRALHPAPDGALGVLGALIVGSGGRELFRQFGDAPERRDGPPSPLDRFTRAAIGAAAEQALDGTPGGYRLLFPFVDVGLDRQPALPFQRLGRAAGLGAPGPLGLQVHPVFGPWWAYRGLVALALPVEAWAAAGAAEPLGDGCAGCEAPCVQACPAGAVRLAGFSVADCHARRLAAPDCRLSCVARIRCVRGPEHRYTDEQLAFHMAASMPLPRP
jgi:ferredoxin